MDPATFALDIELTLPLLIPSFAYNTETCFFKNDRGSECAFRADREEVHSGLRTFIDGSK